MTAESPNGPIDIPQELDVFRNWVIGLVTGCEGCTAEATAWVESQGEITTTYHAERADDEPPT